MDYHPALHVCVSQNPAYVQTALAHLADTEYKKLAEVCYHCLMIDSSSRPMAKEILEYLRNNRRNLMSNFHLLNQRQQDRLKWDIKNTSGRDFWYNHLFKAKVTDSVSDNIVQIKECQETDWQEFQMRYLLLHSLFS